MQDSQNRLRSGSNKTKGPMQDSQNRLRSGSNKTKGPMQDSQNQLRSGSNKIKGFIQDSQNRLRSGRNKTKMSIQDSQNRLRSPMHWRVIKYVCCFGESHHSCLNIITLNLCSCLLTITAVICWSINTKMVVKSAGISAAGISHRGFLSLIGFINQFRSGLDGCKINK